MKALILAAGYGTRLYSLIQNTPKAFLKVNGKPLINYLLEKLNNLSNLNEVLVVTNNKFFVSFEEWAKKQDCFSFPIRIINDETNAAEDRLGSIGDIQYVIQKNGMSDDLLVVGSDNLFDYSLKDFIFFSQKKSPGISIGVYDVGSLKDAKSFGVVRIDQEDKVVSFEEKPENPQSSLIAMCLYYFPKDSLPLVEEYLKETKKSDRAGDYIRWIQGKKSVFGFKFIGKWYDIGSVESYKEAEKNFVQ